MKRPLAALDLAEELSTAAGGDAAGIPGVARPSCCAQDPLKPHSGAVRAAWPAYDLAARHDVPSILGTALLPPELKTAFQIGFMISHSFSGLS